MLNSPVKILALSIALLSLPLLAQNRDADTASVQGLPNSNLQARITGAIKESSLVTLHGNTHPLAQTKFDLGPAPVSMPASRLILVLARSTQQEAALQTYLQSVQDANSPNFQKFLSPEDFGKSFGVGDADLQSIQAWLTSHGFTVNKVSKSRMAIEFSGTVGQVQSAFHTSIHSYLIHGEQQWANTADPQIPSALAPVVAGLASLNSFKPKAQVIRGPSALVDTQKHTVTPSYTFGNANNGYYIFLGPADAATIYDTPTSLNPNLSGTAYTGAGATIGIVGDSNIDVTQNANYRTTFGLSANPVTVVVDGADPGENGDAVEAYLDTEVSGGIAPSANVILYTAADTTYDSGLFLAILRALDDNQADILSVSFEGCESAQGSGGNQYIQELWEQAAAQGISVTVSAGDNGSAGCDDFDTQEVANQGLAVNGIASTPYNIAVGGTDYDIFASDFPTSFIDYVDITNTLPNHRSALKYIPEEPWNDSTYPNTDIAANKPISATSGNANNNNIVAGSGGISSVYNVPAWQSSVATGTGRNLPDVSFLAGNGLYGATWGLCTDMDVDSSGNPITDCASPTTGNNFNLTGVGGTSASAPAFAGMLALLKQKVGTRLGQADYVIYDLANSSKYSTIFHDVIKGDNSVYCEAGSPDCSRNSAGYYFMTGYDAATGYDLASGLGSVDISQLASNWASPALVATNSTLQLNGATTALKITHGQSVAVSASVTSSSGTPSGDIALVDSLSPATNPNSEGIAGFTLSSGTVSSTTTFLPGGSYNVSAHYGGSNTDAESDSNAIPVTVAAESSTTDLTVQGYYDPETGESSATPYYGYVYVIDAQPYGNSASSTNPNGVATGTITFKSGTSTLGTADLSSEGIAELQTGLLPGGNDSLTAVFPGDASFKASTSSSVALTVTPAPTTLVATNSNNNPNVGNSVTITATFVDSNGNSYIDSVGAAPTGTITFMNGTTTLGSSPVTGTAGTSKALATGSATFITSKLPQGENSITATYNGDVNYAVSSPSNPTYVYVTGATANMTVVPASSSIKVNQPLQVSVTLAPSGSLPAPTGTVTITALSGGSTVYTSATLQVVNGTASVTIPANSLPLGALTLSAAYSGDSTYASNSSTANLQVNSSGTVAPTVTVSTPKTNVTFPFSVTVNVSGPNGDPVPTGSVSLSSSDPSSISTSQPLTNGSTTFTIVAGQSGIQSTLTANYLGDNTYTAGSGTGTVTTLANSTINFTPSSPTIAVNQPLSMTVTVATVAPFPAPTGTITLSSGSYTSSAVQLTAGSASFTIPANSLSIGGDLFSATYSGDSNYLLGSNFEYVYVTSAVPPGFTISGTAVSIAPGATTGNTSTITVTPTYGFTGTVNLSCAISPTAASDPATCSISPTSVTITDTTAKTSTLTVSTTAASSAALRHNRLPGEPWYAVGGATLACLLLFGIPARRRSWRTMLGMLALLVALSGGILACGGGGNSGGGGGGGNTGTTPGTYTITVTGTSGTLTATKAITLTVQ
jgi:hypothetical protein